MPPVRVPGRIALYGIFRPLRYSPLEQQPPKRTVSQCRVLQILVIAAHFFLSGQPRFSLSVFMSIAATARAAKIYVFMGFHPGEPFQSVRTDNKWVMYKLLAIVKRVAKGYSSGFGIKNLQTQNGICLRRLRRILHFALVFFMSRPEHPSFAATRLSGVKQLIQPHCLWTHEVKKKLQPI